MPVSVQKNVVSLYGKQELGGSLIVKIFTMMNAANIQNADLLDIIFDGRYKAYGAYTLRKYYANRLLASLSIVLLVCAICFGALFFQKARPVVKIIEGSNFNDTITFVRPPTPKVEPPLPRTAPPALVRQNQEIFTNPLITEDDIVDKPVPQMRDLDKVVIGTTHFSDGEPGDIAAPPPSLGGGIQPVTDVPKPSVNRDTLSFAEHPATFPGDWRRYLERNLVYPQNAIDNDAQGVVKVQFIVDVNGKISNVVALNNPGYGLAEEAIRIISTGPKWKPAEQNGRKVIFRQVQSIHFLLH